MEERIDDGQNLIIMGIVGKEGRYSLQIGSDTDMFIWGQMVVKLMQKGANGYFRGDESEIDLGNGMILRRNV